MIFELAYVSTVQDLDILYC